MVNKPKIQGTRFETYIVNKAKSLGMWSRRLAEGGSKDEGDLEIIPTNSPFKSLKLAVKQLFNEFNAAGYKKLPAALS